MRTPRAVSVGALLQPALDAPDLDAEVIAGRIGLDRSITSPHLQKTGLALAGFDEYLRPGRILVLGESEIRFLASRATSERRELAARLLGHEIPAILSTAGLTPIVELVEACNLAGVPLLLMSTPTGTAMAQVAARLDHHLAARIEVHGVLVDLLGLGVLIVGESGIGKSECGLELVSRGHRLVADDVVELRRRAESFVDGSGPEATRFFMEVRGLGLIDVQAIFGVVGGVRDEDRRPRRAARAMGSGAGVRPARPRGSALRPGGREGAARADAGRPRAQHRHAGRSGGPQRAAQGAGLSRRENPDRAPRRRVARAGALEGDEVSPRRAGRAAPQSGRGRFVVLTGLSGAGKSQAIRALEDLGYFCVDNLPTQLVPTLAALSRREGAVLPKVALVIDVREGGFLREFPRVWRQLKATPGLDPALIFLEASHEALVRRFSETRRPHPLAHGRPVVEGIRAERRQLQKIRALADEIIDTTHLTVHQLRERFQSFAQARGAARHLLVTLLSFGFKFGVPLDADIVLDVRFLPNPHFVPALKPKTGKDRAVVTFLRQQPITDQFLAKLVDLLRFLVPEYVREGKAYLTVAIGCTGGRHRSVMIAEALRRSLDDLKDVQIRVRHRDVEQPT